MKTLHSGYGYECVLRDGVAAADAVYENHCHPFYEIILVMSGEVSVSIENKSFYVKSGGFVLIAPGEYHSVVAADESEYRRITLLFEEFVIPRGVKRAFLESCKHNPVGYHDDMPGLLLRLASAMRAEDGAIEGYAELIEAIITETFYLVSSSGGERVADAGGEGDRLLELMLAYISSHITEKITLDDIANAALVSKFAVCHIFKNKMHTTFKQYLLQKKVSYAAHLIQSGMTAGEAAKAVGYDNYAGFYKVYKKFLTKAPSDKKSRI